MDRERRRRAKQEIIRLSNSGLGLEELFPRVWPKLAAVVPFDRLCWHTTDPATGLMTTMFERGMGSGELLPTYEYEIPDVNKWLALARQSWPVGLLSRSTHGYPESSPRYRDLLRPKGIVDELRASLVVDGQFWGFFGLYRDRGRPDFSEDEAALVSETTTPLAAGLRKALLLGALAPEPSGQQKPGLLLLDRAGELITANPEGIDLIARFVEQPAQPVPLAVLAVAARTRRAATGEPDGPTWNRTRTADGQWLMLHGTMLGNGPQAPTAVIIEPARPAQLAELVVLAYGFTAREREVTRLVVQGRSTAEIARELHLSPYTVQDHLKAVFEKVGVHSRRELTARMFQENYWSRVLAGTPVTPDGWFAAG